MFPSIFTHEKVNEYNINKCKIKIIINYDNYPEKRFLPDVDIFIKANSKVSNVSDVLRSYPGREARYKDFFIDGESTQIFKIRDIENQIQRGFQPHINYDEYENYCSNVINLLIVEVLKHDYDITEGLNELDIVIVIDDFIAIDAYGLYDDVKSLPQEIFMKFSGQVLIGRIYGPHIFNINPDSNFFLKFLTHELRHHVEHMKGLYKRELKVKEKLSGMSDPHLDSYNVIYQMFCNLYTEGIAMLSEKQNAQSINFDLEELVRLRKKLWYLANIDEPVKAQKYYDEVFCPSERTGDYYFGFLMCYFIGLSEKTTIKIFSPEKRILDQRDLNGYLRIKKIVQLEPLDPQIFLTTFKKLAALTHYRQLIELYDHSCDIIGLKEPVKFYSLDFHDRVRRRAILKYQEILKKRKREFLG
jgi:hypothetical protein